TPACETTSRCRHRRSTRSSTRAWSTARWAPASPAPGSAAVSSRSCNATTPTTCWRRWRAPFAAPEATSRSGSRSGPARRLGARPHPPEQLRLLRLVLLRRDVPRVPQPRELLDLLRHRRRGCGGRGRRRGRRLLGHRLRHRIPHRIGVGGGLLVLAGVHLPVDL